MTEIGEKGSRQMMEIMLLSLVRYAFVLDISTYQTSIDSRIWIVS